MPVFSCLLRLGLVCCHFEEFAFCGQGPNVMDLSSEMNRHGKNPVSHKLEDQKKVRDVKISLLHLLLIKRIWSSGVILLLLLTLQPQNHPEGSHLNLIFLPFKRFFFVQLRHYSKNNVKGT